jgi:iron complex outermembrane receptor protein
MKKAKYPVLLALLPLALETAAYADDAQQPSAQSPQSPTARVVVTGTRDAEDHYRVPAVDSIGPLGTTPVLDTPYSVGILSHDLIENSQATNFKDVSKYLPLVAYQEQQGPDVLRPQTRGMQGGNFQNTKLDGMTMFITVPVALEQFEQIEVVNGLTASLYGPANPSGIFNFVSKRPTPDSDLREVTASYNSDSVGTAKVDLSGKIDPGGIFSYRLNALYGSGEGYVDDSHQRRTLGDIGLDIRPWAHGVLELNYSDYRLINKGFPGWFTYGETIRLPSAPDPSRVGYGQSYAGVDLHTRIGTARIKQDLGSNWHLVAGILNQDGSRNMNTPVNNVTSSAGAYTSSFANGFAPRFIITSDTAYLNGNFDTWGIGHDFTFGTAGYRAQSYSVTTPATAVRVGELRFVERLPAGFQYQRHTALQRLLVGAFRCQPGLVSHRQLQREECADQPVRQPRSEPHGQLDVQAGVQHDHVLHLRERPPGGRSRAGEYGKCRLQPAALSQQGV